MRRRTFVGFIGASLLPRAAAPAVVITSEDELFAAIAAGARRFIVRGTIYLTRPLTVGGLHFLSEG
jgi:hypothetical protein